MALPTIKINFPLEFVKSTSEQFKINAADEFEYKYKKKLFSHAEFLLDPKNFEATLGITEKTKGNEQIITNEGVSDTSQEVRRANKKNMKDKIINSSQK